MKKLESLTSSKFKSFEGSKIESLSKIFGGLISSQSGKDCDTYSWTPKEVKDANGNVLGTQNLQDNVTWFKCNPKDTLQEYNYLINRRNENTPIYKKIY